MLIVINIYFNNAELSIYTATLPRTPHLMVLRVFVYFKGGTCGFKVILVEHRRSHGKNTFFLILEILKKIKKLKYILHLHFLKKK